MASQRGFSGALLQPDLEGGLFLCLVWAGRQAGRQAARRAGGCMLCMYEFECMYVHIYIYVNKFMCVYIRIYIHTIVCTFTLTFPAVFP